jgi:hypothetical protein
MKTNGRAHSRKNYALESLQKLSGEATKRCGAILRLNGAGRRYLIEDGSSISKGVDVLSAVGSDIDCVILSPIGESETVRQKCRRE